VTISADGNVVQKEADKKLKVQEFMYRDSTNVKHKKYDYTSNNLRHRNSKKK
jgi:hypothetical protein